MRPESRATSSPLEPLVSAANSVLHHGESDVRQWVACGYAGRAGDRLGRCCQWICGGRRWTGEYESGVSPVALAGHFHIHIYERC